MRELARKMSNFINSHGWYPTADHNAREFTAADWAATPEDLKDRASKYDRKTLPNGNVIITNIHQVDAYFTSNEAKKNVQTNEAPRGWT